MGEIRVGTWGEFEALADEKIKKMAGAVEAGWRPFTDRVLFRGQADAGWGLKTTLERAAGRSKVRGATYHEWMKAVQSDIASFSGRVWDNEASRVPAMGFDVKGIEFMVYLRQNGFPSPLLDWTASPDVAGYFAFRDVQRGTKRPEYVAIYTYEELPEKEVSFRSNGEVSIRTIGPTLVTDDKHHRQKCQYTLCMCGEGDEYCHTAYPEEPADMVTCDTRRCVVEKYVIPMTEQEAVLRRLQMMNVTAYSLFGTEAALMESLAVREVFLGGR